MAIPAEFIETLFGYVTRREPGHPSEGLTRIASMQRWQLAIEGGEELSDLFYSCLPGDCWGNPEAVVMWSRRKFIERQRLQPFYEWLRGNGFHGLADKLDPPQPPWKLDAVPPIPVSATAGVPTTEG